MHAPNARRALHGGAKVAAYIAVMESKNALHSVPDDELLRRLGELVFHSRRVESDLVLHIGEAEERRLYAREACPSMFAYCTERLHLSEAEAYLRITVARAARKHPPLLTMLGDGRLHLSGIVKLLPILTPENRDELLLRATHRSKRQIEELVAELSPRPDAPSVIRKLPQAQPVSVLGASPGPTQARPSAQLDRNSLRSSLRVAAGGGRSLCPGGVDIPATPTLAHSPNRGVGLLELGPDGVEVLSLASGLATSVAPRPEPPRPAIVEPLSPDRYRVQFTASALLRDKLERLTALMRSEVPDGDLAAIVEAAVTEKLERIEARRYGRTSSPRKDLEETDISPTSRHIPAAVRRAVRERDGDRCGYVDERGRRCSERARLEFHHRHPFGMGGDHSPANISLLCPSHNRYVAEHDYGPAAIRRRAASDAFTSHTPRSRPASSVHGADP